MSASAATGRIHEAGRVFVFHIVRLQISWFLFIVLVAALAVASAQTRSTVPAVETIVGRMAQARAENQSRFRPYSVTRLYELFGKEEQHPNSQVVADVNFVPPDLKNFYIHQTNSRRLPMIVRRMLASEAKITKEYGSSDFSAENYDFLFSREEYISGHRCYVLELLPKRKEKHLFRGNIWVDANTYLLHRTEGEPAKAPSWWISEGPLCAFLRRCQRNVAADGHGRYRQCTDTRRIQDSVQ